MSRSKDKRDIYYRKAKEEAWRARSAFKLIQIDEYYDIFKDVKRAVDICAAPGSWSQVLSKKLYETAEESDQIKIVAVDLQEMAPLPGVIQIKGDITKLSTAEEIIKHFSGDKADLVVCDGAPDVSGLHDLDVYVQGQLLLSALYICANVIKYNGTFVAKIFLGVESDNRMLQAQFELLFENVEIFKPDSSRNTSMEAFIVCKKYSPPAGFDPTALSPYLSYDYYDFSKLQGVNRKIIPILVCGDMDHENADTTYPLDKEEQEKYDSKGPVQPPIHPPYEDAIKRQNQKEVNDIIQNFYGIEELLDNDGSELIEEFKASLRLFEDPNSSDPIHLELDDEKFVCDRNKFEEMMYRKVFEED